MKNPQVPTRNSPPESSRTSADPGAGFAAHYQRMYPILTSIAAGVLGQAEGAEDVVQQAVGIALEKGRQYDTPALLSAWLAGAVRNCALNYRRRKNHRNTPTLEPAEMRRFAAREGAPNSLPIDTHTGKLNPEQAEFDDELLKALQTLTPEARCCLLLRLVHNLAYEEISTLLGVPAGTAMSHVSRSKQKLRELLTDMNATDQKSTTPTTR